MRVLTRPPPPPPTPPPPQPPPSNGVVTVGFISHHSNELSTNLLNKILDSNVFNSLSTQFPENGVNLSYYYDREQRVLFVNFCGSHCDDDAVGDVAEIESRDLRCLLFMFTVCHVIIYVQEGSCFNTQLLRNFRLLQAAKHALAPYVKTQIVPPFSSKPHSSLSSKGVINLSKDPSPMRSGGTGRNASLSVTSALCSYSSLYPGQCAPVLLFVFIDEFSEVPNTSSNGEDSGDTSSLNATSSSNSLAKPNKGSAPVVVLARPYSKSEVSIRKKLQSSLEAQIRFLIKKCRPLSGSESSHAGSRSGGGSSSGPLFSLDSSRAVILLDRSRNQTGESLEFATSLLEDVLSGKVTSDSLLLDSHDQNANKDDICSVREFIYRQCDILRGKGGPAHVGVGMVAAAAAAAAASTASLKTVSTPELPSLERWLSSSQLILHELLSAKPGSIDDTEKKPRSRNSTPAKGEGISSRNANPLDVAVSWLESGRGLNSKFSTLWCQKALPAAKDIYLKELPACYPTSRHKAQLESALHAFRSMVKGPAVESYAQKLENECNSIWKSGRQQCDAVSLTGKPCMHQIHDVNSVCLVPGAEVKPHCSGFVFLHACACGRSRKLRFDPFDFETANVTSNRFPECDKFLPALKLPDIGSGGPIRPSSWSLIRVGGARYYEPSKGLLQSGFCASQRYLMKWGIFLENLDPQNGSLNVALQDISVTKSKDESETESSVDITKLSTPQLYPSHLDIGVGNHKRSVENIMPNSQTISFGKLLPNFTMKKPFSEVVAGSPAANSEFPPLQQNKKLSLELERIQADKTEKEVHLKNASSVCDLQGSHASENKSAIQSFSNSFTGTTPVVNFESNIVPVTMNGYGKNRNNPFSMPFVVYIGFEHECPRGHRFLLNPEHLNELGPPYSQLEELQKPTSAETLDQNVQKFSKSGRTSGHRKGRRQTRHAQNINNSMENKVRNVHKAEDLVASDDIHTEGRIQLHSFNNASKLLNHDKDLDQRLQSIKLNDDGHAVSMLNRNLPIYMNCPHCKTSKNKDSQNSKFAGTVSQLQRIFLVTPSFPIVLATNPVVQFEASCLPSSVPAREQKLQLSLGCQVILPPESFLTLRLPFVYGVQLEDGTSKPLNPFEHQPELTAWLMKGSALDLISKGRNLQKTCNA